ncbi:MAG: hypothetical protein BM556_02510 [Bacteriovorax sp. MedPE-SWde]|nr:MAG: hypothetical protein BM556_02510 [Bacteriovorax sp. MedPE-SWde]
MKKLILGMLIASTVSANTIEEAQALFSQRSNTAAGIQAAQASGDMYRTLAEQANSDAAKAELKVLEAEAIYFVSNRLKNKDSILASFERVYKAADFAQSKLEGTEKANALYWYAAAQGRWGETKGILSSLSRWKNEMKPALLAAEKLDISVQQYGIARVIGKAYLKVPGEEKSEGMKYVREAYENTLTTVTIDGKTMETSKQVNNTLFYLFGAVKLKLKGKNGVDLKKVCTAFNTAKAIYAAGSEAMKQIDEAGVADVEQEMTAFFKASSKDYKKTAKLLNKKCK